MVFLCFLDKEQIPGPGAQASSLFPFSIDFVPASGAFALLPALFPFGIVNFHSLFSSVAASS